MWENLVVLGVAIGPIITAIIALVVFIAKRIWGERGKRFVLKYARLGALALAMLFWGLGAWAEGAPEAVPIITAALEILLKIANLLLPLLPPISAMLGATGLYHILKKPTNGFGK